jgi:hypothetical protein
VKEKGRNYKQEKVMFFLTLVRFIAEAPTI